MNDYTAQFLDGPLAGRAEARGLVDGGVEDDVHVPVSTETGTSVVTYRLVDSRRSAETWLARYRYDRAASEPTAAESCRPNWGAEGIRAR
jgi:small ligand-binding sensory domain FIST